MQENCGKFIVAGGIVAVRKRFGRPSDIAIVADCQSTPTNNPGFKQGIRIGTAKEAR
jgi:hypothetical protein